MSRSPHVRAPWWRVLLSPKGILALAAVLRVGFVLTMGDRFYFSDTTEYLAVARQILGGHGFGGTPRAPLFPLEMALGILLGGGRYVLVTRLIQCVLSVGVVALSWRIGERLGGRAAGALSALGVALAPTLVFVAGMLYPTTLYTLALLAATLSALELADRPGAWNAVLMALSLILAWLTDPVAIAPAVAMLVWAAFSLRRAGPRLAGALALAVAILAVAVGAYGHLQRDASGGRVVFMQKAQFIMYLARTDSTLAVNHILRLKPGTAFVQLPAGDFIRRELALMRAQPAAYAHDVGYEFLHFFKPMPDRVTTKNRYSRLPVLLLGAVSFFPVLLFSCVGLLLGAARSRERILLFVVIAAAAGFYSFFFTQTRYRIPVEPHMIVLAALGALRLWPGVSRVLEDPRAGEPDEPAVRTA